MSTSVAPVFIVGMNGSGTTMLLDSLGRHPELYAFPKETRLIPFLATSDISRQNLEDDTQFRSLWEAVLGLNAFVQANGNRVMALPANWQDCPRNLAGVLDAVLRQFAAREGKTRWCEKSPQYAQHLELLARLFPEARFIHVIRDGRDCAASFNRRWQRSPALTIYRWKKLIAECRRQSASLQPGRYMELRYEQLTTEPELWLRKLCDFLSLPFDAVILQSSRPYLRLPETDDAEDAAGQLQANSGKWQDYFSAATQRRLDRIAGRMLQECGYQTRYPASDLELAPLERRILSARDAVAQYGREIALKLQGKVERPWRVILAKPFAAIKQRALNKF